MILSIEKAAVFPSVQVSDTTMLIGILQLETKR